MLLERKPLLILSGPTAVGKTATSLGLAACLNGEIINADSMQVYRGMNIGTAKISPEEQKGIIHHLIDVADPSESYDVMRYQTEVKSVLHEIYARGHLPVLVGGTGFYIQAVLYDIDFSEREPDTDFRREMERYAALRGAGALHDKLRKIDPQSADTIHANNIKRVIRALEYHHTTGQLFSEHNREQREKESPYEYLYAVLTLPKEILYERIDRRVDEMMKDGLEDEVRSLLDHGLSENSTAMQGLGYKEIAAYLRGEYDRAEAIRILKRDTRHYAKRQMTWFRRERDITFFDKQAYNSEEALIRAIQTAFERKQKEHVRLQ